jgi:hypothetical protein
LEIQGVGAPWVFLANPFEGVLGVVRKSGGVMFYCIFKWKFFKNLYRGYMRCPLLPSLSPLCASMPTGLGSIAIFDEAINTYFLIIFYGFQQSDFQRSDYFPKKTQRSWEKIFKKYRK